MILLPVGAVNTDFDHCSALWDVLLEGDQWDDPLGHLDAAGWIFPSPLEAYRACGLDVQVGTLASIDPQATGTDGKATCVYAPMPEGTEAPLAAPVDIVFVPPTGVTLLKLQCFGVSANLEGAGGDVRPLIYYGSGTAGAFLREFQAEIAAPGGTDLCSRMIGAGYRECSLREPGLDLDNKVRCYAVAGTMSSWTVLAAQYARNPSQCPPPNEVGSIISETISRADLPTDGL